MNTENCQEKTPRFNVGNLVWLPKDSRFNGVEGTVFAQATITAVVYSRGNGKSTFEGYMTSDERRGKIIMEDIVFATREEVETLIDKVEAEVEAEKEAE